LSINGVPSEEFKRLCLISLARLTGTTLDWTDEQIQAVLKDIESLPKEVVMKTLTMPEPPAMATPPGDESQPNQETSEVGMQ
jgi:hypothetical protein